jgi:anti-sigma regulatory factor (Ser/Thr protein kinase)
LPVTTRPLQSNLELGALPSAVACARLHAKHVAWEWGLEKLADTVELIVSELATNAIKAAVTFHDPDQMPGIPYIWLRLTGGQDEMLVEVWDSSPDPPMLTETDVTTERGRGLLLVESESVNWGYYNLASDVMPSELSAPTPEWAADAGHGTGQGDHDGSAKPAGKVVWALIRDR